MHDDEQVGRILSRREALALLGTGGAALLGPTPAASAVPAPFRLPACIVRPSQMAGPYFVDTGLERSDIRSDPASGRVCEGTPLALEFRVSRLSANSCGPLPGAVVDLWQCDALGAYSGVEDLDGHFDTRGQQFLRGHQVTDAQGRARFLTIYPGWYPGRAVHLHFTIRTNPAGANGQAFTSQLYFDEAVSDRVHAGAAYTAHAGRAPRNADDGIYRSGGDQLRLDLTERDGAYAAVFDIGLQLG